MKVMTSPGGDIWKNLVLRPFINSSRDFADLAHVSNETLSATSLPGEFSPLSHGDVERFYNNGSFNLEGNAWLFSAGDRPLAAAVLYPRAAFPGRPPGNFHLYVVPSMWRNGLGARLLDHLEQAAGQRGYPTLETTIAAEDSRSTRFLTARGFKIVGQSVHLARPSLDNLPAATLASGYAITQVSDIDESARLYRETANRLGSYDSNYSLVTSEQLGEQLAQGVFDPAGVLFLSDPAGRIVGVIRARYHGRRGYLREIRLEPSSRGQGLGTALVGEALRYLASRGAERAELDTNADNAAALSLAQKTGFTETRHWLHFLKPITSSH